MPHRVLHVWVKCQVLTFSYQACRSLLVSRGRGSYGSQSAPSGHRHSSVAPSKYSCAPEGLYIHKGPEAQDAEFTAKTALFDTPKGQGGVGAHEIVDEDHSGCELMG
jgi:hypothetical protein